MTIKRRDFVKTSAAGAAALAAGPFFWPKGAAAAETIKVGAIYDLSGALQLFGVNQWACAKMAIDEINAAGGVLGKQLEVKTYDSQSQMQFYNQYAKKMALRDKVVVVQGGLTSSSREVIRPLLHRLETLYIYNTNYEGGVCDRNFFSTGSTPGGYVDILSGEAMKRWGKSVYIMAADYNYGQITAKWIRKAVKEVGGQGRGRGVLPARRQPVRPDDQQDPGGQARLRDERLRRPGARLVLRPVGRRRHEQAHPDGLHHVRCGRRGGAHAGRDRRWDPHLLFLLRGSGYSVQQGLARQVPPAQRHRLRLPDRRAAQGLVRMASVGRRGQGGRHHGPHEGDRGDGGRHHGRRPRRAP